MKITITDILGVETVFEKADINLLSSAGILTVYPNGDHSVMYTYMIRNLIKYTTKPD